MNNILSAEYLPTLEGFVSHDVLLAFDFDGTLAPIVSDPDCAELRRSTRQILKKLTSLYPCVIVSGRSRSDVRRRIRGIPFRQIIGNHGIEPWDSSQSIARKVRAWSSLFGTRLKPFPGAFLEDKGFSLSIHYRKANRKRELIKAIQSVAGRLRGARLLAGKQVINILPVGLADKGLALKRETKRRRCERVIYVGDDKTDESVFALARHEPLLTIRVGAKRSSLAQFYIPSQREMDRLLRLLISLRAPRSGP